MIAGKVVLVTGAGRGIGRDIALLMAASGARVVVNDLGASLGGEGDDTSHPETLASEIRDSGGEAVSNTDSVTTAAGAENIVRTAIDSFGRIDGIVNNAGILRDGIFHKMTEADWRAVIDVHLNGSFLVSRAAAPYFREQKSGSFIHMTSTSGLIGNIGQANYSAAKLGIAALSKSIALDMARYNVRSNAIAPFAWSRMIGSIPTDTPAQQARVEKLKQMTPAKIAPLTVFLASDAARDVSGQIFAVRMNEIFLMSQPRPLAKIHCSEGWTPEAIADELPSAFQDSFYPLERSADVFHWDPI
ncbi:MAG: SDR family oxidoreductase [Alphaproteobacteria bacterium]|nr:SDR family oxidoreductase [Alphaproteobacteria bacterium]